MPEVNLYIHIFISISHLDIMQCTILTNFYMQIVLIFFLYYQSSIYILLVYGGNCYVN